MTGTRGRLRRASSRGARIALAALCLAILPTCTVCDTEATPGFFTVGSFGEPSWMDPYTTGVFKLRTEVETLEDAQIAPGMRGKQRIVKRHYCTAFLSGDARTLWTNRHGFPYVASRGDWQFPDLRPGMRLEFQLQDRDGRLVFDTRRAGDHAKVEFAGRETWVRLADGSEPPKVVQASASDFVRILLSRALDGHVFESAAREPIPGEQIYALGWPSETQNRRPSFGEPDSDGRTLRFTAGRVTDDVPFEIVDWKERTERFDASSFAELMFLTTADCELGMSGSPIVDAGGRVLGILSISFARRACPGTRQASGIRWPEVLRLEREKL